MRHEGRYFVIDWKSNYLGAAPADYGQPSLAAAMAQQNYHLQSLLYCTALDRWLHRRLPHYDRARQFGGSLYLFVRGVRPDWTDAHGMPCGLYFDRPSASLLTQLSALFDAPAQERA